MAMAKKLRDAGRSVKSATKKIARKVDKAVVEPVSEMLGADGKSRKDSSKSSASRAKQSKKK